MLHINFFSPLFATILQIHPAKIIDGIRSLATFIANCRVSKRFQNDAFQFYQNHCPARVAFHLPQ